MKKKLIENHIETNLFKIQNHGFYVEFKAKNELKYTLDDVIFDLGQIEKSYKLNKAIVFNFLDTKGVKEEVFNFICLKWREKHNLQIAFLIREKLFKTIYNYKIARNLEEVQFFTNKNFALSWISIINKNDGYQDIRKPLLIALFCFTLLLLSFLFIMNIYHENQKKKLVANILEQEKVFKKMLIHSFEDKLQLLDEIALKFSKKDKSFFSKKEALNYFNDFLDLKHTVWLNQNNDIIASSSKIKNISNLIIDKMNESKALKKSHVFYIKNQSTKEYLLISTHPVLGREGSLMGNILGIFDPSETVKRFSDSSYVMKILVNENTLFDSFNKKQIYEYFENDMIDIRGVELKIVFSPSKKITKEYNLNQQYKFLYVFVFLSFIISYWIFLSLRARLIHKKVNERFRRYNAALNDSALISETDLLGRITRVNKLFIDISKYSEDELLGQDHRILNSGEHSKHFFKTMWESLKAGLVWKGEIRNKAKDGSYYWVQSNIHPKYDHNGNISGYISIRYDITQKKNQEFEIVRAKNKAVKAEKAKTEFLANMSHEIRTPMNGILGMVELLHDTKLSKEQSRMLNTVRSCGDSLLTILNDILDLSKIESGKLDLELINFNLNECIQEAIDLNQIKANKKGIFINYSPLADHESWYVGDITRIRQIVVNFLSNAVKFTDEGGVYIDVNRVIGSKGVKAIEIEVKDTGIGMKELQLKKLFKAFSQADSSTTRKYGGTGLGLYISEKLARSMGGKITVNSEYGVGTTFKVELKLKEGKKEKTALKRANFNPEDLKLAESFPHKILLVEDNSVNQKLAKIMLKKLGYSCDIAANGLEALKAFEELENLGHSSYSLVFMDMQMPEMDGVTATRELKSRYGNKEIPIIAMTANVYKEDKARCFEAGMVDFVAKPIKIDEIKRVLMTYHKGSKAKNAS